MINNFSISKTKESLRIDCPTRRISYLCYMISPALYTIKLPQFEGPFDLLLFFIERDELDIHDIPIAKLTGDFLNYLHTMERLNINMASEFIVMAATLMEIKAKVLLPRKPVDEEGNELDPRQDLVQKLLEYKRYKQSIDQFEKLEDDRLKKHPRGHFHLELRGLLRRADKSSELESIKLYKLMDFFARAMEKYEDREKRKNPVILRFDYDMETEKNNLYEKFQVKSKLNFTDLFQDCVDRIHAIIIFLAILDLVGNLKIAILNEPGINNLYLSKAS